MHFRQPAGPRRKRAFPGRAGIRDCRYFPWRLRRYGGGQTASSGESGMPGISRGILRPRFQPANPEQDSPGRGGRRTHERARQAPCGSTGTHLGRCRSRKHGDPYRCADPLELFRAFRWSDTKCIGSSRVGRERGSHPLDMRRCTAYRCRSGRARVDRLEFQRSQDHSQKQP